MRIQLKQNEIEAALKAYLATQGIAVVGKEVSMDFTAGRRNKGISVEVVIEDGVQPSMSEYLPTVDSGVVPDVVSKPKDEPASVVEATDMPAPALQAVVEDPKPVGSLFGSAQ